MKQTYVVAGLIGGFVLLVVGQVLTVIQDAKRYKYFQRVTLYSGEAVIQVWETKHDYRKSVDGSITFTDVTNDDRTDLKIGNDQSVVVTTGRVLIDT